MPISWPSRLKENGSSFPSRLSASARCASECGPDFLDRQGGAALCPFRAPSTMRNNGQPVFVGKFGSGAANQRPHQPDPIMWWTGTESAGIKKSSSKKTRAQPAIQPAKQRRGRADMQYHRLLHRSIRPEPPTQFVPDFSLHPLRLSPLPASATSTHRETLRPQTGQVRPLSPPPDPPPTDARLI